ncbi:hypothetical protein Fot_34387 [Forsythia ovata]|uniref:Uncharacterized protein n=1 Tax=Forsythia ovata TaxID=205694 RepID=A0ABD1SII9_9LAMI
MDPHSNAQEEILTHQIKRGTKSNNLPISDHYVPNVEKDTEANVSKERACVTLVVKANTWQKIARERLTNQISKQQHGFLLWHRTMCMKIQAVISGDVQVGGKIANTLFDSGAMHSFVKMPIDVFSIFSGEWVVVSERREIRWVTTTDFWSYLTHAPHSKKKKIVPVNKRLQRIGRAQVLN